MTDVEIPRLLSPSFRATPSIRRTINYPRHKGTTLSHFPAFQCLLFEVQQYYYREIAEEEAKEKSYHLHYNIFSPTNFLEWIAALVIAGVAYDTIKYVARNVCLFIKEKMSTLGESDEKVIEVLEYEEKLIRFVKYTREFHAGLRDVDPEIVQYIQKEINADFTAEQTGAILNNEHRCPTAQEIMKIMQKRKSRTDLNIHYKEELEIFEELKKKSFRYRKGEG